MEPYELRRRGGQRIVLRILSFEGPLVVTAPWYVPRFVVDQIVAGRADWIAARRKILAPQPLDRILVWGSWCRVRIVSPGKLPRVVQDSATGEVSVRVPAVWGEEAHRKLLEKWEADRVRAALGTLVPAWEAKTGLKASRWTVKRLRSRWGSCRPGTASLVFNARLGALPPACLEHVVVHELAHLAEPSHNARFHALVDGWLPETAEVKSWLRSPGGPSGGAGPGGAPVFPSIPGEETEP